MWALSAKEVDAATVRSECTAVDRYLSAFFRPAQVSRRNRWVSSVEPDLGSVVMPGLCRMQRARYFSDSIQAKHTGTWIAFVFARGSEPSRDVKIINHVIQSGRAGCDSSSAVFLLYRRLLTLAGKRQARAILNDEIRNTVDPERK